MRAHLVKRCAFGRMPRVSPIGQMRCAFAQMRQLVKSWTKMSNAPYNTKSKANETQKGTGIWQDVE